jgi:sporulation protein YlmC with PRC-barrel domain
MTENLISAISRFLTPDLVGKLASATGIDPTSAQKATEASVPTILSALMNLAGQPGGARQIADTVSAQSPGFLGSLANSMGGLGQIADKGSSSLTSLIGGNMLNNIVSSVGRFSGIGEGAAQTMVGLMGPIVMGALGRQQRAEGLDANGLGRLLAAQKDNIAAAIPSGLSSLLPQDLLQGLDAKRFTEARTYDFSRTTQDLPRAAPAAMHRAVSDTGSAAPSRWPLWLLPLAALAGLFWYMLPDGHAPRQTTDATTPSRQTSLLSGTVTNPTYLTRAADDQISIGSYYQRDIYGSGGERLGSVKDLIIGPDGRITAAVLSVGRFLGIGEKDVAVPFSSVLMERKDGELRLSLNAAKDALQAAPAFEAVRSRPDAMVPRLINQPWTGRPGAGEEPAAKP